jgi:hypothetical protein
MNSLSVEMTSALRDNLGDDGDILQFLDERQLFMDEITKFENELARGHQRAETVQYQAQQVALSGLIETVKSHRVRLAELRAGIYPVRHRDPHTEEGWYNSGKLDHVLPQISRMQYVQDTIDDRRIYITGQGQTEEEIAEEEAVWYSSGQPLPESLQEVTTERSARWALGWRDWLLSGIRLVESRLFG